MLNLTKLQKILLILTIIIAAIGFAGMQLSKFAVDSSLNNWEEGIAGYVSKMREQKQSDKPVALFFYTDWCPNCKKLREEILASAEVQAFMKEVLPVKINPESGPLENQLSEDYGVFGYPTVIIIPGKDKTPKTIRRTSNITPAQFVQQCKQAIAT